LRGSESKQAAGGEAERESRTRLRGARCPGIKPSYALAAQNFTWGASWTDCGWVKFSFTLESG
jgi:hypothetical protein